MIRSTKRSIISALFNPRRASVVKEGGTGSGFAEASLYHALIIIFLEFFSWGLLTVPIISVLAETFPNNSFLMNGLILGVKGILSFLSAPLIGALSDIWGRKAFLLLTVFCTCLPIPFLRLSPWWYFTLFSLSGIFSVTFSVVNAYVADITDKENRSAAYGLVSATFAASLITSPALGAWLSEAWSDDAVIMLATCVAAADVIVVLVAVPESLPPKLRHTWDRVTWDQADPFASLRRVGEDRIVWVLCLIVFLSYLPEAGQFSSFFVYLKLVVGFSPEAVAAFIGIVGILSVFAQTAVLAIMTRRVGTKSTIQFGLICQCVQLLWYAFGTKYWMMWSAGILAALSQLTYPAVSAFVSIHSAGDRQGTVQGMVTGIRGLCQGIGPALFGAIFYAFNVDLQDDNNGTPHHAGVFPVPQASRHRALTPTFTSLATPNTTEAIPDIWSRSYADISRRFIPGPPFLFGAMLVLLAIVCNTLLPIGGASRFVPAHGRAPSLCRKAEEYSSVSLLGDEDAGASSDRSESTRITRHVTSTDE